MHPRSLCFGVNPNWCAQNSVINSLWGKVWSVKTWSPFATRCKRKMSNGRSEPRQLLQTISTYFSFGLSFSPCQVPTVSWCLKKASFSGEAQVDDHQSSYGALPRGLCSQVLDQNGLSGSKWCTTFHVLVQASRVVFHPDKADVDSNGIVSRQEFERLSSTSSLKTQNMADHDRSKIAYYATNGVLFRGESGNLDLH